jgi:hypothetical protein
VVEIAPRFYEDGGSGKAIQPRMKPSPQPSVETALAVANTAWVAAMHRG